MPFKRSIENFQAKPDYRLRCYERLQVASPFDVIEGPNQLAQQFGLPLFARQSFEAT